ncbi:hypothetical protein [Arthrobacter pascens]|uniref:hypothetical protein n=1 Tax=Arthrobacter pascens TaxID=1677 RepID=UPI0027D7859E|nr:hypothetical protein [Arthrobacter pascens]
MLLPLWLGSCVATSGSPGDSHISERTATPEALLEPAPQPQYAPPAGSSANSTPPDSPVSSGTVPDASPGASPSASPGASPGSGGAGRGQAAVPGTAPVSGADPSSAPSPAAPPSRNTAGTQTVTAYYVLLDDGGSGGVRFGCNDSLVGIRHSIAGAAEPLHTAMRALLDSAADPADGLYNSLSASTLEFLAGSFDGTTVTAYLAGTIRPGGTCDIPRMEAQLTQTAVSSVGAIRAEIYVNGVGLTEALSLK